MLYILDHEGNPAKCDDARLWGEWMQLTALRKLAHTTMQKKPEIFVSTVFLGCDHQFRPDGYPILWETMVFNDDAAVDEFSQRYATREQALEGHCKICELVKESLCKSSYAETDTRQ